MTGILLDIAVLAVAAGFGWFGAQMGLVRSLNYTVSVLCAFAVAAALLSPIGKALDAVLPMSKDLCNLFAGLLIGIGTYFAFDALLPYFTSRISDDRSDRNEFIFGGIPGVIIGVFWAFTMVALFALMPANNIVSRAAISSNSGGYLIEHTPGALKWLTRTFPHYTQTLPKGEIGAITKKQNGNIVIHLTRDPRSAPEDAGVLLGNINRLREDRKLPELTWNLEIARAAVRHSRSMFTQEYFSYIAPTGQPFEDRMKASIGNNINLYEEFDEQIIWAHDVPTAYAGLIASKRAREILLDPVATEIGIGVVDGGWFSGRMYTLGVVSRAGAGVELGENSIDIAADETDDSFPSIDSTGEPAPEDFQDQVDEGIIPEA